MKQRSAWTRSILWLATMVAWGCGSTTVVESDDTSSASSTSSSSAGGNGGNGGSGAATTAGGVGGGAAGLDCSIVPELIANLHEAAATCAPEDPGPHCLDVVDGYCCPVPVESISAPATLAYLDFLELTKQDCPDLWDDCAVVDCAFPENVSCTASPSDPTKGQCTSSP